MNTLFYNDHNNPQFFAEKRLVLRGGRPSASPGDLARKAAKDILDPAFKEAFKAKQKPGKRADALLKAAKAAGKAEKISQGDRRANLDKYLMLKGKILAKANKYEIKKWLKKVPALHKLFNPSATPIVEVDRSGKKLYAKVDRKTGQYIGVDKKTFTPKPGDILNLPTDPKGYQRMMKAARSEKSAEKSLIDQLKDAPKAPARKPATRPKGISGKLAARSAQKAPAKPTRKPTVWPAITPKKRVTRRVNTEKAPLKVEFKEGDHYRIAKKGEKLDASALIVKRSGKEIFLKRAPKGYVDAKGKAYAERPSDKVLIPLKSVKGKLMEDYAKSKATSGHRGDRKRV